MEAEDTAIENKIAQDYVCARCAKTFPAIADLIKHYSEDEIIVKSANGNLHKLKRVCDSYVCICGKTAKHYYMRCTHAIACKELNEAEPASIAKKPRTRDNPTQDPSKKYLDKLNLTIEPEHGLLVCRTCRMVVVPSGIMNHLVKCQRKRGESVKISKQRGDLKKAYHYLFSDQAGALTGKRFDDWVEKRLSTVNPPVSNVGKIHQGYWCEYCNYAVCSAKCIREHYTAKHQVSWNNKTAIRAPVQRLGCGGLINMYFRVNVDDSVELVNPTYTPNSSKTNDDGNVPKVVGDDRNGIFDSGVIAQDELGDDIEFEVAVIKDARGDSDQVEEQGQEQEQEQER